MGWGERLREDEREGGGEGEREVVFQLFGNLQFNLKEAKLSADGPRLAWRDTIN